MLVLSLLALACANSTTPEPVGGETHFLHACDGEAACGLGLECVCGVCTKACSDSSDCGSLNRDATCELASAAACVTGSFCDVQCTVDAGCDSLGAGFICTSGLCRHAADPIACGSEGDAGAVSVAAPWTFDPPPLCGDLPALVERGDVLVASFPTAMQAVALSSDALYVSRWSAPHLLRIPWNGSTPTAYDTAAFSDDARVHGVIASDCEVYFDTADGVHVLLTDGTGHRTLAQRTPPNIGASVADDAHVYFWSGDDLLRVPRDGGETLTLATRGGAPEVAYSLVLGDGQLIWFESDGSRETEDGAIAILPTDGSRTVANRITGGFNNPRAVVYNDGFIYVVNAGAFSNTDPRVQTSAGSIVRVPASGGTPQTLVADVQSSAWMTVVGSALFWTRDIPEVNRTDILGIAKDGTGPTTTILSDERVGPLLTDGSNLYWGTTCGADDTIVSHIFRVRDLPE